METLHTWWATELYPMRERDQFGVSGEFEVVLATDAQATIAALQARVKELEQWVQDQSTANLETMRHMDEMQSRALEAESQLTQRTAELHETQNHLADADNEVEQLRKQLSERTAELEAVQRERDEWRRSAEASDDANDIIVRDLQAELERVRALIKALPKVEGDWTVSCALAVTVVTGGIVRDISEVVAAIVQHRQGMEG